MATSLGSGAYGTAFLVDGNVLKLQKIYAKERKCDLKYVHWREIDVMKNLYGDPILAPYMPKLLDYKIDYGKVKYVHPVCKNIPTTMQRDIERRNESPYTFCIKMNYVGKRVESAEALSPKSRAIMMVQMLNFIYQMNSKGYSHNDIHWDNILRADKPCRVKLGHNNYIDFPETFSLIDFGVADHAKISGKIAVQKACSHQDVAYLYLNILLERHWDDIYPSYINNDMHPIIEAAQRVKFATSKLIKDCPSLRRDVRDLVDHGGDTYDKLVTASVMLCYASFDKRFKKIFKNASIQECIKNIKYIYSREDHITAWVEEYRSLL